MVCVHVYVCGMSVYVPVCPCVHRCMHAYVEARGQCWVSFSIVLCLISQAGPLTEAGAHRSQVWLPWLVRGQCTFASLVPGLQAHSSTFIQGLGTLTQVFVVTWQVLYQESHLSSLMSPFS